MLTIGVSNPVGAIGYIGPSAPSGGFVQMTELHSNGLITADAATRAPIGRIAEKAPTLDDGSVSVLPDGRMRVVFTIRKGVTWHDGTPFSVHDLVFSHRFCCAPGLPNQFAEVTRYMDSVEAADDSRFVVFYKAPTPLGITLGPHSFWPMPQHLLDEPYQRFLATGNADEMTNLPYWTSGYVHTGPFRVNGFDPGVRITFEAHDGYFLGRPKIDVIHLRLFSDQNALLAELFAGEVQMTPPLALTASFGADLEQRWRSSGEGKVHLKDASTLFLDSQWRRSLQLEPAILDPRVRGALLQALDREAISDALNGGLPERAAWSLLSADDPLYEAGKDLFRRFPYDADRAKAILRDSGWTPMPDGTLRNGSDGRVLRTSIWGSSGRAREAATYSAYWRAIGIEVEEFVIPAARNADREFRSQFPGWTTTGSSFVNIMGGDAASAENRWTGNQSGYENPEAKRLVITFNTALRLPDQIETMNALGGYFATELSLLPLFHSVHYTAVARGVRALDDIRGAEGAERLWGGYYRNAHLWELE
jgi:peptide/nickel transport system substrate-binding protein